MREQRKHTWGRGKARRNLVCLLHWGLCVRVLCTEQKRRSMCMRNICLFSMWRFMGFTEGRGWLRREWEVLGIITHPPSLSEPGLYWNLCLFGGFGTIQCMRVSGWLGVMLLDAVVPQAWRIHVSHRKWQCCHDDSCMQFAAIFFVVSVWGGITYVNLEQPVCSY